MSNIVNQGTGAGGANTNANGLSYEVLTNIDDTYNVLDDSIYKKIHFNGSPEYETYINVSKSKLHRYMNSIGEENQQINKLHGARQPDDAYINNVNNEIYIIEKKFQQNSGSVCEKLQTAPAKIWNYQQQYPNYTIKYAYVLSDWFKDNCKAEIQYLEHINIPIFWGSDENYKQNIVNYIRGV